VAILYEARDAFYDTLDQFSLADATANRDAIAHQLNLDKTLNGH